MNCSEICNICGKDVSNGLGGEGMPRLNKLLQNLPSTHLFYNASVLHDLYYHYMTSKEGKVIADKAFLTEMLLACDKLPLIKKHWFRLQAYRNYYAVKYFGDKFYYGADKCEGRK